MHVRPRKPLGWLVNKWRGGRPGAGGEAVGESTPLSAWLSLGGGSTGWATSVGWLLSGAGVRGYREEADIANPGIGPLGQRVKCITSFLFLRVRRTPWA
jgi:hypothetical protein